MRRAAVMLRLAGRFALLALALPLTPGVARAQPAGAAASPDALAYIARQGWTVVAPARASAKAVPGIAPLVYMSKNASAPSCALLADTGAAPALLELSAPEAGESYPQCLGVIDAAQFKLNDRAYVVFEYLTRETREDTYRRYYYVTRDAAGHYVNAKDLNESASGPAPGAANSHGDNPPRAREGVTRARTIATAAAMPAMKLQERDYLIDGARSFAIFQDKAKIACTFVVDDGGKAHSFAHTLFAEGDSCAAILAASRLEAKGATYYIALFKGAGKTHVAVVSVGAQGVVKAENELAIAASTSSTPGTMKEAKTALMAVLK